MSALVPRLGKLISHHLLSWTFFLASFHFKIWIIQCLFDLLECKSRVKNWPPSSLRRIDASAKTCQDFRTLAFTGLLALVPRLAAAAPWARAANFVKKPPLIVNVTYLEVNCFNASMWVPWSPSDPKKWQCIDQFIQIHQICVNKHKYENHINLQVSLHFWSIWPTVRRHPCGARCRQDQK